MTVVSTTKDPANLRFTLIAEFSAPPERVWQLWQDPRQLERWWGPPVCPAIFTRHEFRPGGESRYSMTGPDGQQPRGWWRIQQIEEPWLLVFLNGLAGEDGEPVSGVEPIPSRAQFEPIADGTRMTVISEFVSTEQMEQMLGMGMVEGMTQAIGQIDELLAQPVG